MKDASYWILDSWLFRRGAPFRAGVNVGGLLVTGCWLLDAWLWWVVAGCWILVTGFLKMIIIEY
jgi:hypothetical protein